MYESKLSVVIDSYCYFISYCECVVGSLNHFMTIPKTNSNFSCFLCLGVGVDKITFCNLMLSHVESYKISRSEYWVASFDVQMLSRAHRVIDIIASHLLLYYS